MPPSPRTAAWRHSPDGVEIRVADRAVVLLTPADGRVRVGLVMPVVDRVIDVSVQPTTACSSLEEAARRSRTPASSVEAATRAAVREAASLAGAWSPADHLCLPRALGGIAFPLLAAAYDAGAEPVGEVPRWAAPVLAAPSIGDGARIAFGARATRPVRRALVGALAPGATAEIDLAILALALIGSGALEPDRLARVMSAQRAPHPPADLPDPATLRAASAVVREWEDVGTEAVLADAAGRSDGLRMLLDTVAYARQLGDHGPHPLPRTLTELHDVHRALVRTASDPTAGRVRDAGPAPVGPGAADADGGRDGRPVPRVALPPPSRGRSAPVGQRFGSPAAIRALDGLVAGDLRFVLPHAGDDLVRWGRILSNCLGDFRPAVGAGRSIVVGVLRRNRLTYAVELTPNGCIRQFNGHRNRPPSETDLRTVLDALVVAGALDTTAAENRPWLHGRITPAS